MFKSPVFFRAISHRFELRTIMRQNKADDKFVNCLKELRKGVCSDESFYFIKELQRELVGDFKDCATHIFFRKVAAQVFNLKKLQELQGPENRFPAIDVGCTVKQKLPS